MDEINRSHHPQGSSLDHSRPRRQYPDRLDPIQESIDERLVSVEWSRETALI